MRSAAVALLARRDFACGELRQALQSRGYEPGAIESVIAELLEERFLDDTRYADRYVATHAARGQGPVRIRADLRGLGLPEPVIEAAVSGGQDWRALAIEVRTRRFGPELPESWAEKARQARFLQSRGFSSDHIRSATDADFGED